MTRKLTQDEIGAATENPIFEGLSEALKDTSCYAGIEKRIAAIMYSDHPHKTLKGFVRCKRCLPKMQKRQDALKEIGFASYPQYLEWRRVMSIIIGQQNIQLT
jgi:hypothetical protein